MSSCALPCALPDGLDLPASRSALAAEVPGQEEEEDDDEEEEDFEDLDPDEIDKLQAKLDAELAEMYAQLQVGCPQILAVNVGVGMLWRSCDWTCSQLDVIGSVNNLTWICLDLFTT